MLRSGELVNGTYQVMQEIGEGGAGLVYLAYHLRLEKYVVLKLIKRNVLGFVNARKEVDMLKSLHHKYLPQVYDYFQQGSEVYTVIDYIEGYDLSYYIKNGYEIPEELAIKWLLQLTEVLEYLHGHKPQIIHSDIKPSNIMITPDMDVCLIDFNISLEGEYTDVKGVTPNYSSPEQLSLSNGKGGIIDVRTDIYSLGATFLHLLSSQKPFVGFFEQNSITQALPKCRKSLAMVIVTAMSYAPEYRYSSVSAMRKAIEKATGEYSRRFRRMVLAVGTSVIVVSLSVALILIGIHNKKNKRRDAYVSEYNYVVNTFNSGTYISSELRGELFNELLNQSDYEDFLDDNPQQEAILQYIVGYTMFEEGNYSGALERYEQAYKLDSENPDICRELVIAYARSGDTQNADYYLSLAVGGAVSETDISLIQMELLLEKGQYRDVLSESTKVFNSGVEDSKVVRAAFICDEACRAMGEYETNINNCRSLVLQETSQVSVNRILLRECYAEALAKENMRDSGYLELAVAYGEWLLGNNYDLLDDRLVLAKVYLQMDAFDQAKSLLESDSEINSDYRVQAYLALVIEESGGSLEEARRYYSTACNMESYMRALEQGKLDPMIEKINSLLY